MKKIMEKTFNTTVVKCYLIVITVMMNISVMPNLFGKLLKISFVLCLGFLALNIDKSKIKNAFATVKNNRFYMLTCIMFILGLISIVLNYNVRFIPNLNSWLYFFIILVLIFPLSDYKKNKADLICMIYSYIIPVLVITIISLMLFYFRVDISYELSNAIYYVGMYKARYIGIFLNVNYILTTISIILSLIQLHEINKADQTRKTLMSKAFLMVNIVICFISYSLELSRGASVVLFIFILLGSYAMLNKNIFNTSNRLMKSKICCLVLSCVLVIITYAFTYTIRWSVSELNITSSSEASLNVTEFVANKITEDPLVKNLESKNLKINKPVVSNDKEEINSGNNSQEDQNFDSEVKREKPSSFLNNRLTVWKYGMEKFINNPIFGNGPITFSDKPFFGTNMALSHFHNIVVHSLVSIGIVGTVILLIFFIKLLIRIIKFYFSNKTPIIIKFFCAFTLAILIQNMIEVNILFILKPVTIIFWTFAGYIVNYNVEEYAGISSEKIANNKKKEDQ